MERKTTPVRVYVDLKTTLADLAKQDGRSMTNYVNRVLEDHIRNASTTQ